MSETKRLEFFSTQTYFTFLLTIYYKGLPSMILLGVKQYQKKLYQLTKPLLFIFMRAVAFVFQQKDILTQSLLIIFQYIVLLLKCYQITLKCIDSKNEDYNIYNFVYVFIIVYFFK